MSGAGDTCPTCGCDTRGERRRCVECQSIFFVDPKEAAWLAAQGWKPYRRCQPCRETRRTSRPEDRAVSERK